MENDYLREFKKAEEYYGDRNKQMDKENLLIAGEYECYAIDKQPIIRPDLPKRAVEIAASHVATGYQSVDVSPATTEDEKKIAEKLTSAYNLSYRCSDEHLNTDPDNKLASFIAANGGGVMKMLWRPELDFPIIFVPINPAHFFPGPGGRHFYESYRMKAGEVKQIISGLNGNRTDKPWNDDWVYKDAYMDDYADVRWTERWTAEKRQFFLTDGNLGNPVELTKEQNNHFGIVPYAWRATNIASGEHNDPSGEWVSVLRGLETIYEGYARALTAMDYHMRLNAYGEYWISEEAMKYFKSPQSPGTYRQVPDSVLEGSGAMARPEMNLNADFYPFMQRLFDHANDFGVNTILSGVASGEASGRRYESELGAAEKKIVPLRKAFESIKSQCGTMLATMLGNEFYNTDGISLSGREIIKPSHIKNGTRLTVTMEYKDPKVDIERVEMGIRLRERGDITHAEFVEDYLKITKDGQGHLAKVLAERTITENDMARNRMVLEALEELGMDEEAEEIKMIIQQSQQGQQWQNPASHTQTVEPRALPPQGGAQATPGAQRMGGMYAGQ